MVLLFRTDLPRLLIWYTTICKKQKNYGFSSSLSRFPDQPDPEIRKFLQISNGLAKTVNLICYLQKVIFGPPDGPDPPDGAGAGAGVGLGGPGPSPLSPAWPGGHFYV